MRIETVSVNLPDVADLIRLHLSGMTDNSPPESVYALDISGLSDETITLFGAYESDQLLGIGALKEYALQKGEIKSMRTRPEALRRGVGRAILETIIQTAKDRRYQKLSLETGSGEAFEAAISLYKKRGFQAGPKFGQYTATEFNQFFHLDLTAEG